MKIKQNDSSYYWQQAFKKKTQTATPQKTHKTHNNKKTNITKGQQKKPKTKQQADD